MDKANLVGSISQERANDTLELKLRLDESLEVLKRLKRDAFDWSKNAKKPTKLNGTQSGLQMIKDSKFTLQDLVPTFPEEIGTMLGAKSAPEYPGSYSDRVYSECFYHDLVAKQMTQVKSFKRNEEMQIPTDLDYGAINFLSTEMREKLSIVRPRNFAQASRIEGVTSSGLVYLMAVVRKLTN